MPSSDDEVQVVDTKNAPQRAARQSKKFVVTMGQFLSEKPVTAQLLASEKSKARSSPESTKSPAAAPKTKARPVAKNAVNSPAAPKSKAQSNAESTKAPTEPKEKTDEPKLNALLTKTT